MNRRYSVLHFSHLLLHGPAHSASLRLIGRLIRRTGLALLAVLVLQTFALRLTSLSAQTVSTGAIAGTVSDPSGAVIAGVNITATEKATGFKRTATSDASGGYRFSLLPPGDYQLRFEAKGFKSVVPPDVRVVVTEISTLNVQLVLGEAQETISSLSAPYYSVSP